MGRVLVMPVLSEDRKAPLASSRSKEKDSNQEALMLVVINGKEDVSWDDLKERVLCLST